MDRIGGEGPRVQPETVQISLTPGCACSRSQQQQRRIAVQTPNRLRCSASISPAKLLHSWYSGGATLLGFDKECIVAKACWRIFSKVSLSDWEMISNLLLASGTGPSAGIVMPEMFSRSKMMRKDPMKFSRPETGGSRTAPK